MEGGAGGFFQRPPGGSVKHGNQAARDSGSYGHAINSWRQTARLSGLLTSCAQAPMWPVHLYLSL